MKACCNFCKHCAKEFRPGTIQCEFSRDCGYGPNPSYHDWMRGPCTFFKRDPLKNMYGITEENYIREYLFAMLCRFSIDHSIDQESPSYNKRHEYSHRYYKFKSYLTYHKREATKPKKKNVIQLLTKTT